MWMRLLGFALSFALIGYLFHAMNGSDKAMKNAIDSNPAVVEQKKVLKDSGIDPSDPEALKKYTIDQAKKIDEYQHSADNLKE